MGEELAGSDATRWSLVRQVDYQPCSGLSGRTRPLHAIQLHGTRPGGDWGGLDLGRDLGLAGPNRCRAGRQSRHATISTIAQSLRDVLQSSSPSLRCPRRKARCIPSSVYSRVLSYGGKIITGQFRTFATISANCGLVHRTKTARSFDDFVDERKEAGWEGEVYRFCGLEIDQ